MEGKSQDSSLCVNGSGNAVKISTTSLQRVNRLAPAQTEVVSLKPYSDIAWQMVSKASLSRRSDSGSG